MGTKYTALTPIEHDGERVEEGGTLSLDDKQAEPLLRLKAVEVETSSRKRAPKPPTDPVAVQRAGDSTDGQPADAAPAGTADAGGTSAPAA